MTIKEYYDFSCWLIRYDRVSIRNLTYQKDCLINSCGRIIPLLYNHNHNDPTSVLGHVILENRDDGIYIYGTLYDIAERKIIEDNIWNKDVFVSPYVNQVQFDGKHVISGVVREVSLVFDRIDRDDLYRPVMRNQTETL